VRRRERAIFLERTLDQLSRKKVLFNRRRKERRKQATP